MICHRSRGVRGAPPVPGTTAVVGEAMTFTMVRPGAEATSPGTAECPAPLTRVARTDHPLGNGGGGGTQGRCRSRGTRTARVVRRPGPQRCEDAAGDHRVDQGGRAR